MRTYLVDLAKGAMGGSLLPAVGGTYDMAVPGLNEEVMTWHPWLSRAHGFLTRCSRHCVCSGSIVSKIWWIALRKRQQNRAWCHRMSAPTPYIGTKLHSS